VPAPDIDTDRYWLQRACDLAAHCPPSSTAFAVGALIVDSEGNQIAAGYSRQHDDPHNHAEEVALAVLPAGDTRLAAATIYSSLEPCGERASRLRTCVELILTAGLQRVVFAAREPTLFVRPTGATKLLAAGITVIEKPELAEAFRSTNAHLLGKVPVNSQLLTQDQWAEQLRTFERTAFRLELQREYREPGEMRSIERFLAGNPQDPSEMPGFDEWCARVAAQTTAGKRRARVRIVDDPPTGSQLWEQWLDPWNTRAGEDVRYLDRAEAYEIGLLPAAGTDDWWLLDGARLVVMRFDVTGRRVENELVTDLERVTQAQQWWDLAVRHSSPPASRSSFPREKL
jgi:pyrimidine deaminase RibD-like protein